MIKMIKVDNIIDCYPNTISENEKILHKLQNKNQHESNTRRLTKLFTELNCKNILEKNKNAEHINASWYDKNVVYGPISGFLPGSWWGIRMDCSRDHVHSPFDADIQDGPSGVTSICTSNTNMNKDVDLGDFMTFTGQLYSEEKPDNDPLIKNYKSQIPLRLVRSYNLSNVFAPKTGYRYDGLYIVIAHWISICLNDIKYHKFAFMRLKGQKSLLWNVNKFVSNSNDFTSSHDICEEISDNQCTFCYTCKLRNCSHNSNNTSKSKTLKFHNPSIKNTNKYKKQMYKSTIVKRCVSKKTGINIENVAAASTSSKFSHKKLSYCGAKIPKARNTNISIRTNLYDSSHNVQDLKKDSLMTLYKSLKPASTSQHYSSHKGTFGLLNKSRSVDKVDVFKVMNDYEKVNYICQHNIATNASSIETSACTVNTTTEKEKSILQQKELPTCSICKTCDTDIFKFNDSNNANSHLFLKCMEKYRMNERHDEKSKPVGSLDLTPDKILNLINNQKCHPLAKYLIGNVIGLAPEEPPQNQMNNTGSIIVEKSFPSFCKTNALENNQTEYIENVCTSVNMSRNIPSQKFKMLKRCHRNSQVITKEVNIDTCQKLLHCKKTKVTCLKKRNLLNNLTIGSTVDLQEQIQQDLDHIPTDVIKRNMVLETKLEESFHTDYKNIRHIGHTAANSCFTVRNESSQNSKDDKIKENLFKGKAIKNINENQQRITRSCTKNHIHKKKRREIINLLIDAKITPKTRGPRNRRLRRINNMYTKKLYDSFGTLTHTPKKTKIKIRKEKCAYSLKEKRSFATLQKHWKQNKDRQEGDLKCINIDKEKIKNKNVDDRDVSSIKEYMKTRKSNHNLVMKLNNNKNINSKTKVNIRETENTKSNIQNSKAIKVLYKNQSKNILQNISVEACHSDEIKETRFNAKGVMKKPCTIDATVQCSLLPEPIVDNALLRKATNVSSDDDCIPFDDLNSQHNFVKTELNESTDIKSEDFDNSLSHNDYPSYDCCPEYVPTSCQQKNTSQSSKTLSSKEYDQLANHKISAFVPVNTSDNDFRIIKLRSIGFKPISTHPSCTNENNSPKICNQIINCSKICKSKIKKQNVEESYNKCIFKDSNIVIYMDEELQYQNIEHNNDVFSAKNDIKQIKNNSINGEQLKENNNSTEINKKHISKQDFHLPWHGWKKIVVSEKSYWIGW